MLIENEKNQVNNFNTRKNNNNNIINNNNNKQSFHNNIQNTDENNKTQSNIYTDSDKDSYSSSVLGTLFQKDFDEDDYKNYNRNDLMELLKNMYIKNEKLKDLFYNENTKLLSENRRLFNQIKELGNNMSIQINKNKKLEELVTKQKIKINKLSEKIICSDQYLLNKINKEKENLNDIILKQKEEITYLNNRINEFKDEINIKNSSGDINIPYDFIKPNQQPQIYNNFSHILNDLPNKKDNGSVLYDYYVTNLNNKTKNKNNFHNFDELNTNFNYNNSMNIESDITNKKTILKEETKIKENNANNINNCIIQ
jgi:hypothetical protein